MLYTLFNTYRIWIWWGKYRPVAHHWWSSVSIMHLGHYTQRRKEVMPNSSMLLFSLNIFVWRSLKWFYIYWAYSIRPNLLNIWYKGYLPGIPSVSIMDPGHNGSRTSANLVLFVLVNGNSEVPSARNIHGGREDNGMTTRMYTVRFWKIIENVCRIMCRKNYQIIRYNILLRSAIVLK